VIAPNAEARRAMAMFPRGLYLLTAAHERRRAGQLLETVSPCADEPPLICVAARKGHSIEPVIRDSHAFAVCRVHRDDLLLQRRFGFRRAPDSGGDPFDPLELDQLATGSPVPRRSMAALDCRVVRHLDLDADHELYIGLVVAGRIYARIE
jgi:flavin reductase (DIM6/NTAB) family NADH-FMN oxidoreductase RutF